MNDRWGNVNSSVYFIFISMVFIIFAAEDGMRWVGNKRFHSRFTLGETGYPLFEERSSSRDLFFFILSFLFFFFSFKYKIIPIITSLNRREGYNLSYIYYIYMVWIE